MFNFVKWKTLVFFRVFLSLIIFIFYAFFRQRLATSWKPSWQNWGTSKTLCTIGKVSLKGCSWPSMGRGVGVPSLSEFLCGNPTIGQIKKTQHKKMPKHTRWITCSMNILNLNVFLSQDLTSSQYELWN